LIEYQQYTRIECKDTKNTEVECDVIQANQQV